MADEKTTKAAGNEKADDKVSAAAARGLTTKQADELKAVGVYAPLDNRTGDQRPFQDRNAPLLPQQIDGPQVDQIREHREKYGTNKSETSGEAVALKSEGPLGRGEGVEAEVAETN